MKILITGAGGFVGAAIARFFVEHTDGLEIYGIDNFSRLGSETNRLPLKKLGIDLRHADLRCPADLDLLPAVNWVIDAAALPSVLAGLSQPGASRQLMDVNLTGTQNLLEYCRRHHAGLVLISTNRVYHIPTLDALPLRETETRFELDPDQPLTDGMTSKGLTESFSTAPPISLYGASKLCAETLAREYAHAFGLPVWINRCGILAGAGQFGRPDQGILAYWLNSWLRERTLKYIGYGGHGLQVRDCLHPRDLAALVPRQVQAGDMHDAPLNIGGGMDRTFSLRELSDWCTDRWGPREVAVEPTNRPFDAPWLAMDSTCGQTAFDWAPSTGLNDIFEEIANHAETDPEWMEISGAS